MSTWRILHFSDRQLAAVKRIVIIACGTSWHAALVGKFYIEGHCRIPVEVDIASEFRYRNPVVDEKHPGDGHLPVRAKPPTPWRPCAKPSRAAP